MLPIAFCTLLPTTSKRSSRLTPLSLYLIVLCSHKTSKTPGFPHHLLLIPKLNISFHFIWGYLCCWCEHPRLFQPSSKGNWNALDEFCYFFLLSFISENHRQRLSSTAIGEGEKRQHLHKSRIHKINNKDSKSGMTSRRTYVPEESTRCCKVAFCNRICNERLRVAPLISELQGLITIISKAL